MLLYWAYLLYCIGGWQMKPDPSLPVMDCPSCDQSGIVRSTGCLLVINIYSLCQLRLSGQKYLWGGSGWKIFWVWVFPERLLGQVQSEAVLPLRLLHADLMCQNSGSWMHRCVARAKAMVMLLLTYPHVLDQG